MHLGDFLTSKNRIDRCRQPSGHRGTRLMRIVGTVSASVVLTAGVTALYVLCLERGSFSPQRNPGVDTVIGTRSSMIFNAKDDRVPILEKKSDTLDANEHRTLMYAIKTIDDPFSNAR
jgi:hypothetical protein